VEGNVIDVDKHVSFWREGSRDDWSTARILLDSGKVRQSLFFAHLSLEKALKALVTRRTAEVPPRVHDLLRLAQVAMVELTEARAACLKLANRYCLEGRYPESWPVAPSRGQAEAELEKMDEVLQWLLNM
jgi:HEPN domain-containing protein